MERDGHKSSLVRHTAVTQRADVWDISQKVKPPHTKELEIALNNNSDQEKRGSLPVYTRAPHAGTHFYTSTNIIHTAVICSTLTQLFFKRLRMTHLTNINTNANNGSVVNLFLSLMTKM